MARVASKKVAVKVNPEPKYDRFDQLIEVGDIVIFSTSGEMDEAPVTKLGNRNLSIKNSSGYTKQKEYRHVINKTKLMETAPAVFA